MKSALKILNQKSNSTNLIVNYIKNNLAKYATLNIGEIAMACKTSEASIVRFLQKSGFDGFKEFKQILTYEMLNQLNQKVNDASVDKIVENLSRLPQINPQVKIQEIAKKINEANEIVIIAMGNTFFHSLDLYNKLLWLGKNVRAESSNHMQHMLLSSAKENTITIIVSYSGQTKEVNHIASYAKELEIPIISITRIVENDLSKISDYQLFVNEDNEAFGSLTYYRYIDLQTLFFELMKHVFSLEQEKYKSSEEQTKLHKE